MNDIKYIDIAEFRKGGYLQEVNRRFFHPLGLAMEVAIEPDGTEVIGGIWDYRDDPEGVVYVSGTIDAFKVDKIANEWLAKAVVRKSRYNFVVQTIDDTIEVGSNE